MQGGEVDPEAEPEWLTLAEAFERDAGIDLLATIDARGRTDREALAAATPRGGHPSRRRRQLVGPVQPRAGRAGRAAARPRAGRRSCASIPVAEAALARPKPGDPRVAERFELYACGVELANGFGELTDPVEQRRRFEAEMADKQRVYGERYPLDEDFLAALALMPPASGMALGLRPAGDAGHGRAHDRARALGAGRRSAPARARG